MALFKDLLKKYFNKPKKKNKVVKKKLKFVQQVEKKYDLSKEVIAIFPNSDVIEGVVDIVSSSVEDALFISPLIDQLGPDKRTPKEYENDIIQLIFIGKRIKSRFIFSAKVLGYDLVVPDSQRGREFKLKKSAPFFKVKIISKAQNLDERVDWRYVPSYMLHFIDLMKKTTEVNAIPRYLRTFLYPLLRRADKRKMRYLPTNVEMRLWNPAGTGEILPKFDLQEESVDDLRLPLEPLKEGLTALESHEAILAALHNLIDADQNDQKQQAVKEECLVQFFSTSKTVQKIIKGLRQTQYVNLGPVIVDVTSNSNNNEGKLNIKGAFVIPQEADAPSTNGLTRKSTFYLTANIDGKRIICPYSYFVDKGPNKHQLKPRTQAYIDASSFVEILDLSSGGGRIVIKHAELEQMLGRELHVVKYNNLFELGDRRLWPLREGEAGNQELENQIRQLNGRFIGLNIYFEFRDKDFSVLLGQAKNKDGQSEELYADHFPSKVSPMVQLLAEIKSIQLNVSEENVIALGIRFSHKLLSGEPVPLESEEEPACWQKIGPLTWHDLKDFTESTKRYHDKSVQVIERGKGLDAVIARRVQIDLERRRRNVEMSERR